METIISGIASFAVFHIFSHPKSRVTKKMPHTRIKRVEILPNLRIEVKNRFVHIHHWMLITPVYLFVQTKGSGILQSDLLHGFLIGGIVQGLMFKNSLKLIYPLTFRHKSGYTPYLKKIASSFKIN
jgi:hypothetical protein